jgi:hypothetical protein
MYYAKVYLDDDDYNVRYIHVIEDSGEGTARRIAWVHVNARYIYKSYKHRLPVLERTETAIQVRDAAFVDFTDERTDPNPETPWFERLDLCLARLGLQGDLEATIRRIAADPDVPSVPARWVAGCSEEREVGMVRRARVPY